jgi:para-nitrobenzyl esterase
MACVRIDSGEIAGTGTDVRVFRGIPYAAPPLGPLRWRPPQPVSPWTGVHDGSRFGPDPIQATRPLPMRRSLAPATSEDCLNLNIWAPGETPARGAPVMVSFEGGAYRETSASREFISGDAYARRGVVFVSVNYRVGVFGFLAHPALTAESPHHSSGNYGLLDAIAALTWVRENIASFGGDPARVTAIGVSAGAAMVALLLTSPLAEGVIHSVILRSPSSFKPLATLAEAEAAGGVVGDDLVAMRALPAADLLAMNLQIDPGGRGLQKKIRLRTIVDGWVIPQDEAKAFRSGAFAAVPMIVGSIANEGGEAPTYSLARPELRTVKTTAQLRDYLTANFGAMFDEAWVHYGAEAAADVAPALTRMWGDTMFAFGIRSLARALARREPKTFRYIFSHVGKYTSTPPVYGDDMTYAFGTGEFEAHDRAMSDAIVAAFANFAKSGDPNGLGAPRWTPYDPACDNYLTFGPGFAEERSWRTESSDFLERFYRALST